MSLWCYLSFNLFLIFITINTPDVKVCLCFLKCLIFHSTTTQIATFASFIITMCPLIVLNVVFLGFHCRPVKKPTNRRPLRGMPSGCLGNTKLVPQLHQVHPRQHHQPAVAHLLKPQVHTSTHLVSLLFYDNQRYGNIFCSRDWGSETSVLWTSNPLTRY